jgi:ABC-2 type transport system permease protein
VLLTGGPGVQVSARWPKGAVSRGALGVAAPATPGGIVPREAGAANPLMLLATAAIVVLGSAFFARLSMSIAGLALSGDRPMGIGQAITMPLFFSSNALYPERLMPGWLQAVSKVNPLSYEIDALRGLLIGTQAQLALDAVVLVSVTIAGVSGSALLLPRLAG